MRFSSILAPVGLLGLASALPYLSPRGDHDCIPYETGVDIVEIWASTLTNFNTQVAENLLAPSFTDTSASINFLIGQNLDAVTFPSPQAYIAGQGAQPPIGFNILSIDAITCDGVIPVRWEASVGNHQDPVKGISVLFAVQSGPDPNVVGPGGFQLGTLFTEFNSGAWVVDIGGTCTPPPLPGKA